MVRGIPPNCAAAPGNVEGVMTLGRSSPLMGDHPARRARFIRVSSMAYTKLHQSILESTVWSEDSDTRVVWITLLAMADRHGEVTSTIPGLARRANVTLEACQIALSKFLGPDPFSRTPDEDGRRLVPIDGGWHLLNYDKYRLEASKDDRKAKNAARAKRYRDRKRNAESVTHHAPVTHDRDIAEAEAEADSDHESVTTRITGERVRRARAKTARPTTVQAGDFPPPPGRVNGRAHKPALEGSIVAKDWKPADATREQIAQANPKLGSVKALQKELDAFRNWHRAKGIKVHDAEAAFAYWCRPKDDDAPAGDRGWNG